MNTAVNYEVPGCNQAVNYSRSSESTGSVHGFSTRQQHPQELEPKRERNGQDCPRHRRRLRRQHHNSYVRTLRFLWSISFISLVLFAIFLLVLSGCIWSVNYVIVKSGEMDVAEMERKMLLLTVRDHVSLMCAQGPRYLQQMRAEFYWHSVLNNGNVSVADTRNGESRRKQIWIMSSYFRYSSQLGAFWYSTPLDHYTHVGSVETRNGSKVYDYREAFGNGLLYMREYDIDQGIKGIGKILNIVPDYYPSQRPFYKIVQNDIIDPRWTEVFVAKTATPTVSVSCSIPIFSERFSNENSSNVHSYTKRELIGVLSASFSLIEISTFIRQDIDKYSRLVVIQSDDKLSIVASSQDPVILVTNNGSAVIQSSLDHPDVSIRETARMIKRRHFDESVRSDKVTQFKFSTSDGTSRIVGMIRITDAYGLNWIAVVIAQESIILRSVNNSHKIVAILSASIVSVIIILELILICVILQPFTLIKRDIIRVSKMKFDKVDTNIRSYHLFELDLMVRAMDQLKNGLLIFEMFVPSDIVKLLVRKNLVAKQGVSAREVSVMFCNIDHLDVIGEGAKPKELVDLLQNLFTQFSEIISKQGGVIDKYIGGLIMALFNAPSSLPRHAECSTRAAVLIEKRVDVINEERRKAISSDNGAIKHSTLKVTIGINTAVCLVGNIGSRSRVSYTALGDGVNVASRLEGLNKIYNTRIIIGPNTYEQAKQSFTCRWLTKVCLKGKTEPLDVYEVMCSKEDTNSLLDRISCLHEAVRVLLERGDTMGAKQNLIALLQLDHDGQNNMAAMELWNRITESEQKQEAFVNCLSLLSK